MICFEYLLHFQLGSINSVVQSAAGSSSTGAPSVSYPKRRRVVSTAAGASDAEDPSILCAELNDALDQLSNLECDMDTIDRRLTAALSANQAQAAKLKDIEHRHGMDQISLTLLRSTMSSATITIDNMKYVHAAELRELTLSCKKSTAKEVQRALKDLKAEQRESEASYGQKIVSLQRELEDARQPADERAVKMELKMVQLQAKAKKQTEQAVKFSRIVDEMVEGLNGETIEDLMERAQTAEEDKQLGWERCRILQKHTDEAKGDLVKAEAVVKERDGEVKALTEKLYLTNLVLATVKQERRRDGKGDIFHEEGRVLVRCDLCMEVRGGCLVFLRTYTHAPPPSPLHSQLTEDPIAHVNVKHASKDPLRRAEPCPLGCGMVIRPKHYQPRVPPAEFDRHIEEDACKARLGLIRKARDECAQYMG